MFDSLILARKAGRANIRGTEGAGTTTLLIRDNPWQIFNLSANRTVVLPSTDVKAGDQLVLENMSTSQLTVQSSGGNNLTFCVMSLVIVTALVDTPTTAAHWRLSYAVGEKQYFTMTSSIIGSGSGWVTVANITLPAGKWMLTGSMNGSGSAGDRVGLAFSTTQNSAPNPVAPLFCNASTTTMGPDVCATLPTITFELSTTTTIYINANRSVGANSSWGNGSNASQYAVRLA